MSRSKDALVGRSKEASAPPVALGSDFLQLDIGRAPSGGRTEWLTARLREAIADGRLAVGSRLPASRVLAAELRVSRGVVTEAYQRLAEAGQVAGRGRLGTTVVAAPPPPSPPAPRSPRPPPSPPADRTGAPFGGDAAAGAVDALRAAACRIDLSPGVPDLAAFPRAAWLRAERAVLGSLPPSGFGYGDAQGAPALRAAVADWLARNRGIRADPGEVIVVAGVAQALALLGSVLRARGLDRIAVEDPGSLGARQQLEYGGFVTVPVPVDEGGLRVDALRASGARAALLTPAHQFPTGAVLDGVRRRELLAWAAGEGEEEGGGGLIIEDDYDAEHRYDRSPVPALRSMLADRVCYAGSVSKLLAPALRVGWLLVPPGLREAVVSAKRHADLGNALLPQLVLAHLVESGGLERHLRFVRGRHRARRDAMLRAIGTHLPGARVHGAAAGLHLTVTFDGGDGGDGGARTGGAATGGAGGAPGEAFTDMDLAAAALAAGVKAHPLSWHRMRPGPPGLVLGYAAGPASEIEEGIAVLGAALREARKVFREPRQPRGGSRVVRG
ncbi:PLP-dependent aminotransferase family protein [Streptomyces sp. G-G2]|uniref:MocR-like pyridoxine biosynthesis transcription factor PdxR n=1 Tax=Streptomyces sp. G-G2 TaxID=3046201 RepID=UPI0024BB4A9F|nr:PLP-dependent aminotransferase family protein [Streptomyces sp. G-G2]MDJ0379878.1 PLP-dependent aminotransferase family protein [Streptomyces sp. G-G2]